MKRLCNQEVDFIFEKDVERAFDVLQARWHILSIPSRLWLLSDVKVIMQACIILHNMILQDVRLSDENNFFLKYSC